MKILIVLTSHETMGISGAATGVWLEEFTTPYYVFTDAKADVTLASPTGGKPPIDPNSEEEDALSRSTERFKNDEGAQAAFSQTQKLGEVIPAMYDAVFYPGGHGPMWDLSQSKESIAILENLNAAAKPIGAVCHAPAALLNVRNPNGTYLLSERYVTGFSNSEERAMELADVVPFLLEDEMLARGAHYSKKDNWTPHSVVDGNLTTGQNPASSELVAKDILKLLAAETAILDSTAS